MNYLQFVRDRHGSVGQPDPIIAAIDAYRLGLATFNATPSDIVEADDDAVIARTYGPPMAVLDAWDRPAVTFAGALAALKLAREEMDANQASSIADRMLAAALAFLDRPARDFDFAVVEFRKAAMAFDPTITNVSIGWAEGDDDQPAGLVNFAGLYPVRPRRSPERIVDGSARQQVEGAAP